MKLLVLTLFLVYLSLRPNSEAFFHCKRLVRQFYECKHLQMTPVDNETYSQLSIRFEPYRSLADNRLNDSFYQDHLGNLSLAQAFDLFWTIYEYGHLNCSSQTNGSGGNELPCKCVSFDDIDSMGKYAKLFRGSREIFDEVKRTIVAMYADQVAGDEQAAPDFSDMSALDAFCERVDLFPFGSLITSSKILSCADFDENSLVTL